MRRALAVLLLLFASPAWGGYVTGSVRATSAESSATCSDTGFVLSGGANRKVVVGVSFEDGGPGGKTITGVTFNSVAMTRLVPTTEDLAVDTTRRRMSVWYIDETSLPAAGTYTVTATLSGAVEAIGIISLELSGMASGAGVDPLTALNGNLSSAVEITPTVNNSTILVFGFNISGGETGTANSTDYTATELVDAGYPGIAQAMHWASQGVLATAGTVTAGLTWSATNVNGMCAVALSPTGGAPPAAVRKRQIIVIQ